MIANPSAQNTATAQRTFDARLRPGGAGSAVSELPGLPGVTAGMLVIVDLQTQTLIVSRTEVGRESQKVRDCGARHNHLLGLT
ncbi:hypothetical protein MMAGJ_55380 [Mycolicibacterium mageritense]|uniref:Uncharacterized protein n=1 Tax=Mycolicibacterium mageritense TaxID=53462 RepID=A0ABM7I056_MYCME|nr:hypothetical protein MMAGJ_55380 [Mycolicibacterium mageritense]